MNAKMNLLLYRFLNLFYILIMGVMTWFSFFLFIGGFLGTVGFIGGVYGRGRRREGEGEREKKRDVVRSFYILGMVLG